MGKVIDLHCHVAELKDVSILDFFLECMQHGVEIVSITDHKTLRAYTQAIANLTPEEIKQIDPNLKIVIGIEMTARFKYEDSQGQTCVRAIDILGYNLDLTKEQKLDEWVKKHYIDNTSEEYQKRELAALIEIVKQLGYKANYEAMCIDSTDPDKMYAGRVLASGLTSSEFVEYNLSNGLPNDVVENPRCFYNRYCGDPESSFYLDFSNDLPEMEDVINLILECGGIVFIPHSGAYSLKEGNNPQSKKGMEDSKKLVQSILERFGTKISGLEIIHPKNYLAPNDNRFVKYLSELANQRGLNVSGGTDYHRSGEDIGRVPKKQPLTRERLPRIDKWAELYTIQQIQKMVRDRSCCER